MREGLTMNYVGGFCLVMSVVLGAYAAAKLLCDRAYRRAMREQRRERRRGYMVPPEALRGRGAI
jgi:hypothetical protein